MPHATHLSWLGIVRLGLVQASIGAIVVLTTATLNRVMVVELAMAAAIPAAFVAWHYAVQVSRPLWGHKSDAGGHRTTWIVGGMGVLALGAVLATNAVILSADAPALGALVALVAFTLIGGGVGAAGTSLLAMLASTVAPARQPTAAAITWIMMIAGIVATAATSGALLDPYSPQRLALVAAGVAGGAFLLSLLAVWGVERNAKRVAAATPRAAASFTESLHAVWDEPLSRLFTIFVFVSMLAYSAQDLILEPYAGLVFGYTLGQSTQLAGVQHAGVLAGMILVGAGGAALRGDRSAWMRLTTIAGCLASAAALAGLSAAGLSGAAFALQPAVFALGFANGVFAVSAISLMMAYAGAGKDGREGLRMGVWGAAQAISFGLGGFAGAAGLDLMRAFVSSTPLAFAAVFTAEAVLFAIAAALAVQLGRPVPAVAPTAILRAAT